MITHVGKNLYRCSRPESYADLQKAGIQVVVRLNSGFHEQFNDDGLEFEDPSDFGITLITLPMSDFTPATEKQLRKFLEVVRKYNMVGKKVAVYCLHGADRTGSQVLNYEVNELEVPFDLALQTMYRHGFHKFPYLAWVPFLKRRIMRIKNNP